MKKSLSFIAMVLTASFALGALAGAASADETKEAKPAPKLEMTPLTNDELTQPLDIAPMNTDELALPPETIPADPDTDMPMIYNLIEPSETLSDVAIIYAV